MCVIILNWTSSSGAVESQNLIKTVLPIDAIMKFGNCYVSEENCLKILMRARGIAILKSFDLRELIRRDHIKLQEQSGAQFLNRVPHSALT